VLHSKSNLKPSGGVIPNARAFTSGRRDLLLNWPIAQAQTTPVPNFSPCAIDDHRTDFSQQVSAASYPPLHKTPPQFLNGKRQKIKGWAARLLPPMLT